MMNEGSTNRIKVLILSVSLQRRGGVTNYIDLLLDHLPKDYYHVSHFSQDGESSSRSRFLAPVRIFLRSRAFKHILRTNRPDVAHINPSLSHSAIIRDWLFLRIAKRMGTKVLYFIHGWNYKTYEKLRKNVLWRNLILKDIVTADAYVVLASEFKAELVKLGIPASRIHVSSTMVVGEDYYPNIKDFNKELRVVFCANMMREKGPYEVLDSIPEVLRQRKDVEFVFIGKGIELDSLKRRADELGIEDHVRFTGYLTEEDKISEFKRSHVFVFPTMHGEGFPTVILEAMAAGLPVITTPIAGLADAIVDGKNGLLLSIPPSKVEVAERTLELLKDPELMASMSSKNIGAVREIYDAGKVSSFIGSIYQRIMKGDGL